MARSNFSNLPLPGRRYRPDDPACRGADAKPFETREQCEAEDALRAKQLREQSEAVSALIDPVAARALADKIDPLLRSKRAPTTLASMVDTRGVRIRTGNIWQLAEEGGEAFTTATIMPRAWERSPADLLTTHPGEFLGQLRTDLNRAGAANASGWLIAFVHGEFEPETEKFRPHLHLTAAGGMIDVVDALRDQKKYKRATDDNGNAKGPAPIVIAREALTDPGGTIAYTLKPYWPSRRTGTVGSNGYIRRATFVSRIPEPFHSLVLLWLDQWRLQDITLMMGVYATKDGLRVSR